MSAVIGVIAGWFGGVVIHELGHAVAAWITGQGVRRIRIGSGRRIIHTKFAGAIWEINLHPFAGEVILRKPAPYWSWAWRLVLLAGPGANLLLLVATLVLAYNSIGHAKAFWIGLSIPQAILLFYNLVPASFGQDDKLRLNDSAQFALSLRWMTKPVKEIYRDSLAPYLAPGEALRTVRVSKTSWLWDAQQPGSGLAQQLSDGFGLIEDETRTAHASNPEYLHLVDSVTTRWLLNGAPDEFRGAAERATRQALAISPGNKNMRQTRGGVLVELARFAEARDMILSAMTPQDSAFEAALTNLYLARSDAGLGDTEAARAHAKAARDAAILNEAQTGYLSEAIDRMLTDLECQLTKAA